MSPGVSSVENCCMAGTLTSAAVIASGLFAPSMIGPGPGNPPGLWHAAQMLLYSACPFAVSAACTAPERVPNRHAKRACRVHPRVRVMELLLERQGREHDLRAPIPRRFRLVQRRPGRRGPGGRNTVGGGD